MALTAVALVLLQSPTTLEWAWEITKNQRSVANSGDTLYSTRDDARTAAQEHAADFDLSIEVEHTRPARRYSGGGKSLRLRQAA